MKHQIIHISAFQTSKIFALIYFFISIPFIAVFLITTYFSFGQKMVFPIEVIAMPFVYMVFGFIFTFMGICIYNLIARKVGGIEYTITDKTNT